MQLRSVQGSQGSAQRGPAGLAAMPAFTYRWNLASLESGDDAIKLKFAVDVGLLLLGVGRFVDVGRHGWGIVTIVFGLFD